MVSLTDIMVTNNMNNDNMGDNSRKKIFQLYRGGFIGGGNRSTRRKPSTSHKSLTNFIT